MKKLKTVLVSQNHSKYTEASMSISQRVHQNFFIYTRKHYIKQCFGCEVFTALNIWTVVLSVTRPFSLIVTSMVTNMLVSSG
jgi:hypothetical protein